MSEDIHLNMTQGELNTQVVKDLLMVSARLLALEQVLAERGLLPDYQAVEHLIPEKMAQMIHNYPGSEKGFSPSGYR